MTIGIHPTADKIEDFLSENCNHKGLRIVNLSNSVVQPPWAIVVKNYGMKNSQPVSVEIKFYLVMLGFYKLNVIIKY